MKKSLFLLASAALAGTMTANATLSTTDFANNDYTGEWGRLQLVGNQLSSASGEAIQLKGWSTFSINYDEVVPCLSSTAFQAMKAWGANVVRFAVYPHNSKGGYVDDAASTLTNLENYITWASALNMYVLVDWHVLDGDSNSGDPATYKTQAQDFFTKVSTWVKAQGYTNVLYEACNEPSGVDWSAIKSFATTYVLPAINSNDPGAIVIVGTPQWDQQPDKAVADPITKADYDLGIMYAFHYYACTHSYLLSTFSNACSSVPMFVSEWGSGRFDGAGETCCTDASNSLMSYCKQGNVGKQLVSYCYWAWGKKSEYSNCLNTCDSYTSNSLTTSGNYIVNVMNGGTAIADLPVPTSWNGTDQPIGATTESVLNIGFFNVGINGLAYNDANSSAWSDDERTKPNTSGDEYHNPNAGGYYNVSWRPTSAEVLKYANIDSASRHVDPAFRCSGSSKDEVDVTASCCGTGDYATQTDGKGTAGANLHNLCMTESGEWINYNIDVKKKGYYTVQALRTNAGKDAALLGFRIVGNDNANYNGDICRDLSDRTNRTAIGGIQFPIVSASEVETKDGGAPTWLWKEGTNEDISGQAGVIFHRTGVQTLQIYFVVDDDDASLNVGDISNLCFTYVDSDIPASDTTAGVEGIASAAEVMTIYPNPSTNGQFTVALNKADAEATVVILNAQGQVVYSTKINGTALLNANLASGVYAVRVQTENGNKTAKLMVK